MKMNRRKALIGIGSLAVGSGAALGSGAFTSVEAERSVSVVTAGDASAALGIEDATDDNGAGYINEGGNDAINLAIGESGTGNSDGLNDEALTEINPLLTLTNNSEGGNGVNVQFDTDSSSSENLVSSATVGVTENSVGNSSGTVVAEVEFSISSTSLSSVGATTSVSATIDTRDDDIGSPDTYDALYINAKDSS